MGFTSKNQKTEKNTLRKCVRKGDVIQYSKPENINMVKNPAIPPTRQSNGIEVEPDKVSSGESLYKTFNFEQSANEEETEKCIAFWKCVVEKNLQHIKCAIIRNKSKTNSCQDVLSTETATPVVDEKVIEEKIKEVHQEYANAWKNALKEIQRKKLHEMKLIGKSRCKFCESISSLIDVPECQPNKDDINKGIKELDNWKSKSRKRDVTKLKANRKEEKEMTADNKEMTTDSKQMTTWAGTVKSPKDSNTYTFKDVIAEKQQSGAYSAWRENKLTCPCKNPYCTCGYNPAVISFETTQETEIAAETIEERESTEAMRQGTGILTMSDTPIEPQGIEEVKETTPGAFGILSYSEPSAQFPSPTSQEPLNTVESAKFLFTADQYSEYTIPSEYTPASAQQVDRVSQDKAKLSKTVPGSILRTSNGSKEVMESTSIDEDIQLRFGNNTEILVTNSEPAVTKTKQKKSARSDRHKRLPSIMKKRKEKFISVVLSESASGSSSSICGSPETENRSMTEFLNQMTDLKKSISLAVRHCNCSYSDCDCYKLVSPIKDDEEDVDSIPPPPRIDRSRMRKRDSIMVHRDRLRESSTSLLRAEEDEEERNERGSFVRTSIADNAEPEVPVTKTKGTNTEMEIPNKRDFVNQMKDLKRQISLIVNYCKCNHSDCDCYNVVTPIKVDAEDIYSIPSPPRIDRSHMKKKDSLMIYRERRDSKTDSKTKLVTTADEVDASDNAIETLYVLSEAKSEE